jgi:MFS family permease
MSRHRRPRYAGLLRAAPQFRYLWLSRSVSFTGDGVARVALVLLAASRGPGAVSLVLLANTLPRFLGPMSGAVADRVDQRRLLAGAELGQGVIYAVLAIGTLPLAGLLSLVAAAGLLATLVAPAGKSSVTRLVTEEQRPAANALLGTAFNLQVLLGPAIGGALAGFAGTSTAFAVNAASFLVSALLLRRLSPLPPATKTPTTFAAVFAETAAGLKFAARSRVPRALTIGTLLLVSFAAIDNVALVFLVKDTLHGSGFEYGLTVAVFGAGMITASLLLVPLARRVRPQRLLAFGVAASAVGTAGTGLAGVIGLAMLGQGMAGAGNSSELVASDTLVQQLVPQHLLGRVFGTISTGAQIGSAIAYVVAGPLISWTDPRTALVIAGLGTVFGLVAIRPALT